MIVDIFSKAGVNPTSLDPDLSGDASLDVSGPDGRYRLCGVFDGAWVPGYQWFEKDHRTTIDGWSSETTARLFADQMAYLTVCPDMQDMVSQVIHHYRDAVNDLKHQVPHDPHFQSLSQQHTPQCTGAVALFHPTGLIETLQWGDCYIGVETMDGQLDIVTPDQVASVCQTMRSGPVRYEVLGHDYQALVKQLLSAGQSYGDIRAQIHAMAQTQHGPQFFQESWHQADQTLGDDLSGSDGFTQWRETLAGACKNHNFQNFVNRPDNRMMIADNGMVVPASWGMMTGDQDLLPLLTHQVFDAHTVKTLYLGSDGSLGPDSYFADGRRISALRDIHDYGPDGFYQHMLNTMFASQDNASDMCQSPRKKMVGYAADRIPMDMTVITITP